MQECCCVIDGVFAPIADTEEEGRVVFNAACGLDAVAIADVQAVARQRILRAFVRRGLIDQNNGKEMGEWEHGGGFSVDASVCIEGTDRPGLERLPRYCARPPFALERLRQRDAGHLVYRSPKPRPDGPSELVQTPLELIDKIAALVPPPRPRKPRTAPWPGICGRLCMRSKMGQGKTLPASLRNAAGAHL